MIIKYYIKRAYGKEFIIIVDNTQRTAVQQLTKRSTITTNDKQALEQLGITLKEITTLH